MSTLRSGKNSDTITAIEATTLTNIRTFFVIIIILNFFYNILSFVVSDGVFDCFTAFHPDVEPVVEDPLE
jgi:hypothetical protein